MSVSAEQAWAEWVNTQTALVGPGNPLAGGAYLGHQVRSPANGAYAVGARLSTSVPAVVAEDDRIDTARISAVIYAGTVGAAEDAAAAYARTVETLTGAPQPCGGTGVICLVHTNLSGPMFVAQPNTGGEEFAFEVAADFMMIMQ